MESKVENQANLKQQTFTVLVEGNVGCGKTSFLNYFKSFDEFLVLEEPVEKWKDFHGCNLLDLKFNQPERFQFPFQTYATLTRLQQHLKTTDKPIKLMERSLLTARRCFVENLRDIGVLHDGMYHVLNEWYEFVNEFHPIRCDLIIYLRTTPSVAYDRVIERAREEEAAINLSYLEKLHICHEKLFIDNQDLIKTNILVIDANKSMEDMQAEYQNCFQEIKKRLVESENPMNDKSNFIIHI